MSLGFSDLPNIYNISFPVGPNMPNVRDDVLLVQSLLKMANFTRNHPGGWPVEASSKITVDGYFGDQTKRMIVAFEAYVRSGGLLLVSDGVFEPSSDDGYTGKGVLYKIIHLNRKAKNATPFGNAYDQLPSNPDTHPLLREALTRRSRRTPRLRTVEN